MPASQGASRSSCGKDRSPAAVPYGKRPLEEELAMTLRRLAIAAIAALAIAPVTAGTAAASSCRHSSDASRGRYLHDLHTTSFSPALYDKFAIISRPGARLSPG